MNPLSGLFAGLALLLTGATKVWFHLNTAATLRVPGCLGSDFVIELSTSPPGLAHCWGCYVALSGFLIMAGSLIVLWPARAAARSKQAEGRPLH